MKCENCGIKNCPENNYCSQCGLCLNTLKHCEVCREDKKCIPLKCGHSFCKECLDMVYLTNKSCPKCRSPFTRCLKCQGYRMGKTHCLDCYGKHTKYVLLCRFCNFPYIDSQMNDYLLECLNCKKKHINTIPVLKEHYNSSFMLHKCDINPPMRTVCAICLSSNFDIKLTDNNLQKDCNDCHNKNISTIDINISSIFNLKVLDKELVNPTIIKICKLCCSDKLLHIKEDDKQYVMCQNCCHKDAKYFNILKIHKKYYPVLDRNVVNPTILNICKKCYCDSFRHKGNKIYCSNCNNLCIDFYQIYDHHRDMYPVIKNINENT